MNSILRKICLALGLLMFAGQAFAQNNLAPNPWAAAPNAQNYKQQEAKTMNGLPTNPWQGSGTSNVGRNVIMNRGGNVTSPVYTGQSTTWNTAMGQDSIAPEVNVHNMLSMTNHLRKLGYQIPPSFDNFIRTAPAKIRVKIMNALNDLQKGGNDPLTNVLSTVMKDAEASSGFSTENLLGNSLDLLSK